MSIKALFLLTPWWVYLVFIICLKDGIKALSDHEVHLIRMSLLPSIFISLSIHTILQFSQLSMQYFIDYLLALTIGCIVSYARSSELIIQPSKKPLQLWVQGSKQVLLFVLIIFFAKYAKGYLLMMHPLSHGLVPSLLVLFFVAATATGLFLGRFFRYLQLYFMFRALR
jgi:hypothetical protein